MEKRIEASIMLSSYLDTIGFKNGEFEFKYGQYASTSDHAAVLSYAITYEYFILGGINKMSIINLKASDDTLLLLAIGNAALKGGGIDNYVNELIKWYPLISEKSRCIGRQTKKSILLLKKIIKKKNIVNLEKIPYYDTMGGNGAAIRTSVIGLKWYNNYDKIIKESILSSRLTHNYYLGFLGGLITALFTAFALNNIKPWLWVDELLKIYESKKIYEYIHTTDLKDTKDEDISNYFYFWYKYKEERLDKIMTFRNSEEFLNYNNKITYMLEFNSILKKNIKNKNKNGYLNNVGSCGLDTVIFAYDSLLLSIIPNANYTIDLDNINYSIDSLVFFGCLHIGDTDSTGVILGAWFGALNGYGDFNSSKITDLEFYDDLLKLTNKIISSINK
jgi:ADP-ribosylarginine hydrolase